MLQQTQDAATNKGKKEAPYAAPCWMGRHKNLQDFLVRGGGSKEDDVLVHRIK
jgi:hypothetical protein